MPKKPDFMGRRTQREYDMAEDYLNAPMAQPSTGMDVTEERMQDRIRKEKMRESIQKMEDELRYGSEIDFREALRKSREREYKRRGF